MAFMTGGDVKVNPDLTAALGQQGQGPQNSINDVYAKIRAGMARDATTRGVQPSPYVDQRLTTGQGLASANLRSGLEGVLGQTSYADQKSQRDFQQNEEIARLTGQLNKPSTLEEVLSGLGSGANTAGAGYSLYKSIGGNSTPSYGATGDPSLSMFDPYASGYGRYAR